MILDSNLTKDELIAEGVRLEKLAEQYFTAASLLNSD